MATVVVGRVSVTGASGQAGRAVVRELLEHGYDVAATDVAVSRDDLEAGMLRADLTDYGQALGALERAEAVIHLANIPAPGLSTPAVTFNANVAMNFNVFHAAARLARPTAVCTNSRATAVASRLSGTVLGGGVGFTGFPTEPCDGALLLGAKVTIPITTPATSSRPANHGTNWRRRKRACLLRCSL